MPHSEATDTKLSYWVLQSNRMGDVYFDDESVALCSDHLKKLRSLGGVSSGLNTCSVEISQELFSEIEKGKHHPVRNSTGDSSLLERAVTRTHSRRYH